MATDLRYNGYDKIWYGTEAEKDADADAVLQETAKCYTYDGQTLYVSDGTTWTEIP